MSTRSEIRDDLRATIAAIAGIREVDTRLHLITEIDTSRMPYGMVVSSDEERERALTAPRKTDASWAIDVWCYLKAGDDMEAWVEKYRAAIMANRGRGVAAVQDTFIEFIMTDDTGVALQQQKTFFQMRVIVTYRVTE